MFLECNEDRDSRLAKVARNIPQDIWYLLLEMSARESYRTAANLSAVCKRIHSLFPRVIRKENKRRGEVIKEAVRQHICRWITLLDRLPAKNTEIKLDKAHGFGFKRGTCENEYFLCANNQIYWSNRMQRVINLSLRRQGITQKVILEPNEETGHTSVDRNSMINFLVDLLGEEQRISLLVVMHEVTIEDIKPKDLANFWNLLDELEYINADIYPSTFYEQGYVYLNSAEDLIIRLHLLPPRYPPLSQIGAVKRKRS